MHVTTHVPVKLLESHLLSARPLARHLAEIHRQHLMFYAAMKGQLRAACEVSRHRRHRGAISESQQPARFAREARKGGGFCEVTVKSPDGVEEHVSSVAQQNSFIAPQVRVNR